MNRSKTADEASQGGTPLPTPDESASSKHSVEASSSVSSDVTPSSSKPKKKGTAAGESAASSGGSPGASSGVENESFASSEELREMDRANEVMAAIDAQGLTQTQAAVAILQAGVTVLKSAVANHVPMYFAEASDQEATEILRTMLRTVASESEAVQVSYGDCISAIVQRFLEPPEVTSSPADTGPDAATEAIQELERARVGRVLAALFGDFLDTVVLVSVVTALDAWCTALKRWVKALPAAAREEQLWPWLRHACASGSSVHRIVACRAAVAALESDGSRAADALWQGVVALKSDSTPEVALALVHALGALREYGGPIMIRAIVLPCLLDMVCHRDDSVAAEVYEQILDSLVNLSRNFDTSTSNLDVSMPDLAPSPTIVEFASLSQPLQYQRSAIRMLLAVIAGYLVHQPPFAVCLRVTHLIGRLAYSTPMLTESGELGRGDQIVLHFIDHIVHSSNVALRHRVAYNMPGLMLAFERDSPASSVQLAALHAALCSDPADAVRLQVSLGFHEVMRAVSSKYPRPLDTFTSLLEDPHPAVRDRMFAHTPRILDAILGKTAKVTLTWKTTVKTLLVAMADYASVASSDWRKLERLFELFDSLTGTVSAPEIHQAYVPLLLSQLASGAHVLKPASARFLVRAFHATCCQENRAVLIQTLGKVLRMASDESCHARRGFVLTAAEFAKAFSTAFTSTYFVLPLARCGNDSQASVRMLAMATIPQLPAPVLDAVREAAPVLAASLPVRAETSVQQPPAVTDAVDDSILCAQAVVDKVAAAAKRPTAAAK